MQRTFHTLSTTALLTIVILVATALPASAQPTPPVRVIAEWEPVLGTLISWPLGIPQALVLELAEDDLLYVLVNGSGAENSARSTFNSWGIDPAQVEYIQTSVGSHWPRDWGPHQVFDGNGDWGILDPIFEGYPWVSNACVPINSPGGYAGDDGVNADVATYFGANLHEFPAYLTGGNFLVDGHHTGFSTCAMVGENNQLWTEAQFRTLLSDWAGITSYQVVDSTEDHGIQHIDCWMKPLDEETLLVKLPPTWHEEYDRIETNLAQLALATNCYGRPYTIVRIDCPTYSGGNIAAYTNSLILNKKVLVPQFNIPGDAQAIATFQAAMPGYEVIGFPWGSWYYYDALHCRTRAVFDPEMLRITHRRLDAEVPQAAGHTITAMIDDRSETGLVAGELRVYWRLNGSPTWSWLTLSPTGSTDTYEVDIPGQSPGQTVEYYLAAADNSGRSETLPRTAPAGFYSFTMLPSDLMVEISCTPSSGTLPFTSAFYIRLDNPRAELTRRIAGRINIDLAGGGSIGSWRAGYTNIDPGASYVTGWNQALPAVSGLVGTSVFTLHGMDVTPAPYNQPPYPPAGAAASDTCSITGYTP